MRIHNIKILGVGNWIPNPFPVYSPHTVQFTLFFFFSSMNEIIIITMIPHLNLLNLFTDNYTDVMRPTSKISLKPLFEVFFFLSFTFSFMYIFKATNWCLHEFVSDFFFFLKWLNAFFLFHVFKEIVNFCMSFRDVPSFHLNLIKNHYAGRI